MDFHSYFFFIFSLSLFFIVSMPAFLLSASILSPHCTKIQCLHLGLGFQRVSVAYMLQLWFIAKMTLLDIVCL